MGRCRSQGASLGRRRDRAEMVVLQWQSEEHGEVLLRVILRPTAEPPEAPLAATLSVVPSGSWSVRARVVARS